MIISENRRRKQKTELLDIININSFILVDTNFLPPSSEWMNSELHMDRVPNLNSIWPQKNLIDDMSRILKENKKLYFPQPIIDELSNLKEILKRKLVKLNSPHTPSRNYKRNARIRNKANSRDVSEQSDAFSQLMFSLTKMHNKARDNLYYPENSPVYKFIFDQVVKASTEKEAKKDSSIYHDKKAPTIRSFNKLGDKLVDEKLVSHALYHSLEENQSSAILTRDRDIALILEAYRGSISEDLLDKLNDKPIFCYYFDPIKIAPYISVKEYSTKDFSN